MTVQAHGKLISLILVVSVFGLGGWYSVNYYAAGIVDQTRLVEYGYEDDFDYCYAWRPDKFDPKGTIRLHKPFSDSDAVELPDDFVYARFMVKHNMISYPNIKLSLLRKVIERGVDPNYEYQDVVVLGGFTKYVANTIIDNSTFAYHTASPEKLKLILPLLDENKVSNMNNTALHLAILHGLNDIAKDLIKYDQNLELGNRLNYSPLAIAIKSNNKEMINLLLDRLGVYQDPIKIEVIIYDEEDDSKARSLTQLAAGFSTIEVFERLFKEGFPMDSLNYLDPDMCLEIAVVNNNRVMIEYLLKNYQHADLDVMESFKVNNDLSTGYDYARSLGDKRLIDVLARFGIQSNGFDNLATDLIALDQLKLLRYLLKEEQLPLANKHYSAFDYALRHDKSEALNLLVRYPQSIPEQHLDNYEQISQLAIENDIKALENLFKADKAYVLERLNKQDFSGWTPLHYAYFHGNKEMIKLLLDIEADQTLKNQSGFVASDPQFIVSGKSIDPYVYKKEIIGAENLNTVDVERRFKMFGVKVEGLSYIRYDKKNETLWSFLPASQSKTLSNVLYPAARDGNVYTWNQYWPSVTHCLVYHKSLKGLMFLAENGELDLLIKDSNGKNAMDWAVEQINKDKTDHELNNLIIKFLYDKGARFTYDLPGFLDEAIDLLVNKLNEDELDHFKDFDFDSDVNDLLMRELTRDHLFKHLKLPVNDPLLKNINKPSLNEAELTLIKAVKERLSENKN